MSGEKFKPFVVIRPWLRAGILRHLSESASIVLFLLTDMTNQSGLFYVSAEKVAQLTGLTRQTVYGALERLTDIGVIQRYTWREGERDVERLKLSHGGRGAYAYELCPYQHGALRDKTAHRRAQRRNEKGQFARLSVPTDIRQPSRLSVQTDSRDGAVVRATEERLSVERTARLSVPRAKRLSVQTDTQSISTSERETQSPFSESPPIPSLGECPVSGRALHRTNSSSLSSQGQGTEMPKKTKSATKGKSTNAAQKRAEALRLFLEREAEQLESRFRDWTYCEQWLRSTQFARSLRFARDLHRELYDPVLSLPNGDG